MTSVNYHSIQASDHMRGNKNASIALIEYGDFECSFCRAAFPVVASLVERFKGDVVFAFRHYPLTQIHPHSQAAAQAAEAASRQGRFWEMHARLFQASNLSEGSLVRIATLIGLDLHQFGADFAKAEVSRKIHADVMSGRQLGIKGAPTFFLDGSLFQGDWEGGALEEAIATKLHSGYVQA